ncbi:MAG TPA: VOC family protein [Polyangiaceae bacterium]|nr:VOC family protein [Polyangiaceae bacterium]
MTNPRFVRYELRTTDVRAARAFYSDLFGPDVWGSHVSVGQLPERAAAHGAPAHWLGHLAVADSMVTASQLAALGGAQLGPLERNSAGQARVVMKDPFGAVLALNEDGSRAEGSPVAWHILNVTDHERALSVYSNLFGWYRGEPVTPAIDGVAARLFSFSDAEPSAGAIANTARLPGVHTHWMLHFATPDIERSAARVRALGGKVVGVVQLRPGDYIAACDDAQGAAFGLWQSRND